MAADDFGKFLPLSQRRKDLFLLGKAQPDPGHYIQPVAGQIGKPANLIFGDLVCRRGLVDLGYVLVQQREKGPGPM